MEQQNSETDIIALLTDFGVRLRDIEEKQNILKDRVLLIGENIVSLKEETTKDISDLKIDINILQDEIKKMKIAVARIIEKQEESAKKSDIELLKDQYKMFQPLDLARISDIKEIIKQELEMIKFNS